MESFPRLFSPFRIGSMEIKNRIVLPAMETHLCDKDGFVTDEVISYYRERAKGGAGYVTVENISVDPEGRINDGMMCIHDDKYVDGLKRLADEVHKVGGKVVIQLNHAGKEALKFCTGVAPVAPSPIPSPLTRTMPRELSAAEIGEIIKRFADGAERVVRAGADGVEIHMAHGYLVNQFSSFPVICRISADEYTDEGLKLEESKVIAKILERAGASALHVSACNSSSAVYNIPCYYLEEGCFVHLAAGIKSVVGVPIITVGRILGPEMAEKALSFHPKFVVVGLNIGRNIFNTYDVVYGLDSWKQYRSSGFENDKPRTGDELKDISVNFKSWRDYLHEHSKIYGFLSENTRVLREKLGLASPFMTGTSDWSNADPDAALLYDKIPSQKTLFWANTVLRSVDMEDKNIVEGLRLNNILLDELNKKILEGGSTLIVSIIPSKELVYEARIEEAGLRNPYFEKLVTGQQSIRKSILSSCEENNIFCFDMLPYLRGALDDGEVIYMPSVNMHPTSHGYEIFAKGVAEKLNAENIMKNETPLNKQHDE
ncbi:MAG: NADH oxidase [Parcubacteria group bacterium GW2011_GWA2_47_7]|nr:MAG: NADH oxidase [Parcubacteria group bacterium GW2011_GWA2_47_7]